MFSACLSRCEKKISQADSGRNRNHNLLITRPPGTALVYQLKEKETLKLKCCCVNQQ